MTLVTPVDGQPAIAEHVAQLTETLTGVRAEPITLRSPLSLLPQDGTGATQSLSNPTGDALRVSNNLLLPGGDLILEQVHLLVQINGESYERANLDYRSLSFGDGSAAPGTALYFSAPGALRMIGSFNPYTTNAYDLGATAARWRKLWAVDAEFTNPPTVGGVALGALYLPLAGGTLTGPLTTQALTADGTNTRDLGALGTRYRSAYLGTVLSIAGASATANQITHAITTDAQPRLIVDGNGKMTWGPGGSTAQDTTLQRSGVGGLQLDSYLAVGTTLAAWEPTVTRAIQLGSRWSFWTGASGGTASMAYNTYLDVSSGMRSLAASGGAWLELGSGSLTFYTAGAVGAANATLSYAPRLAVNANGTLALTPAAGTAGVSIGGTAQPKISVQAGAPSSPMTGDVWMW